MTLSNMETGVSIDSNYVLTVIAPNVGGTKTFTVAWRDAFGTARSETVTYIENWVPINGPYYNYVTTGPYVNHDAANGSCLLTKITACKNAPAHFLVYVKFWFTGTGCADKEWVMRNISECSPASNKSEIAITSIVTHAAFCRTGNYSAGFKLISGG